MYMFSKAWKRQDSGQGCMCCRPRVSVLVKNNALRKPHLETWKWIRPSETCLAKPHLTQHRSLFPGPSFCFCRVCLLYMSTCVYTLDSVERSGVTVGELAHRRSSQMVVVVRESHHPIALLALWKLRTQISINVNYILQCYCEAAFCAKTCTSCVPGLNHDVPVTHKPLRFFHSNFCLCKLPVSLNKTVTFCFRMSKSI